MSWSSENDPHSSDYLLREVRDELRKLNQTVGAATNTAPPPLPPPATKDFVAGIPDEFLVISGNGHTMQWKYIKQEIGSWNAYYTNKDGDFVLYDNVGDSTAREKFSEAREVWIPYKKPC